MATATPEHDQVIEYDDYIDQQIQRTSFHLKTVDLISGLLLLLLVLLGSLLAVTIVDHWIVGLNFWARLASLVGIAAASLLILVAGVLRPLIRSINPVYSALTVERSFPSLKNGLISLLFFRDRREEIRESVYDGMRAQTAMELAAVPIDAAVDRHSIIKLGYGLVGVAAIWVAYILLSPKDPLQTIQRVVTPWRDIQRPSQVDILDVMPGSVDVFRGRTLDVTAKVQGLQADELPAIEFSTLDGQLLNQRLPMYGDGVPGHFAGVLTLGDRGIPQDLEYRIVAGDAVSRAFEVHAIEAPHIVVDRIEYDYPAYTGKADEIVQGEGDIRAIEGTRITVFGKANQPIQRGHIELLPHQDDSTPDQPSKQAPLSIDGQVADVRFTLRMDPDGKHSVYRGYRLHFTNQEQIQSVDPIEHTIEVVPDLRPIAQILSPSNRTVEVPENGWQKIEVRALDPDYHLTRVQLAAYLRSRGRPLFKQDLFVATRLSEAHSGQFMSTYNFVPREYDLKEGDVVEYFVVADDSRHAWLQNKLDPNRTLSSKQYFRIVAADPAVDEAAKPEGKDDPAQDPQPREDAPDRAQENSESGDTPESSERNAAEQNQPGDQPDDEQRGDDQPGESQAAEGRDDPDPNQQQDSGDAGDTGLQQQAEGGAAEQTGGESGAPGESQGEKQDSGTGGQGNQNRDAGDNASQDDQRTGDGEPSDADTSKENSNGGAPAGSSKDESRGARNDEPLPSTGERDGEVVERIKEHLEERGELGDDSSRSAENRDAADEPTDRQSPQNAAEEGGSVDRQDPSQTNSGQPTRDPQSKDGQSPASESTNTPPSSETQQQNESQPRTESQQTDSQPPADTQQGDSPRPGDADQSKESTPDDGTSGPTGEQPRQESQSRDGSEQTDASSDAAKDGGQQQGASGEKSDQGGAKQDASGETGDVSTNDERPSSEQQDRPSSDDTKPSNSAGSEDGQNNAPRQPGEQSDAAGQQQDSGSSSNRGKNDAEQQSSGDKSGDQSADNGQRKSEAESAEGNQSDQQSGSQDDRGASDSSQDGSKSASNSSNGSPRGSPSGQGDGDRSGEGGAEGAPTGDDANLEYAREVTDLVLEYLRDQETKPDPALLDKLGWKPEDVQKFLRRWDQMKEKARGAGSEPAEGKRKLDDVLRGMGLQAPNNVRRAAKRDDRQRNNRNTGRSTKVPAELLDPFRAFQRALQRTGDESP